mgnify:CR=1 FL=1
MRTATWSYGGVHRARIFFQTADGHRLIGPGQGVVLELGGQGQVGNKPVGLVVHPAPGHPDGTLANALLYHCGSSLSGINMPPSTTQISATLNTAKRMNNTLNISTT